MKKIQDLKVKIFSDGASLDDFRLLAPLPSIRGFTTNPSLMKKAGVTDYPVFVKEALSIVRNKSISFEVFADDFDQMRVQALKLAAFGQNVYVKIPVTNTRGESTALLVKDLSLGGVKVNVTGILTLEQVHEAGRALRGGAPSIVSIFAGRIADTGEDPIPVMKKACWILKPVKTAELLWASTRELLNIFHAEEAGCQIITVPPELLKKLNLIGHDLGQYSLETVKTFYADAVSSGFKL
jgi:transaldolase